MERVSLWALWRREFSGYTGGKFRQDLLAGLTVAAVALPLALAFGVASGATAAAGLVTAILAGFIIGALSGAPYQISGPTGAMSAVLIVISQQVGMEGVWITGLLAGIMILVIGLLRLGRFVAFIPSSVITGFTSGIAFIIFVGQIDNFLGVKTPAAESSALKFLDYLRGGWAVSWPTVAVGVLVVSDHGVLAGALWALCARLAGWHHCRHGGRRGHPVARGQHRGHSPHDPAGPAADL